MFFNQFSPLWFTSWRLFGHVLTVNAFYSRYRNTVILPLGILSKHIFNEQNPSYMNFASLGYIVGHEVRSGSTFSVFRRKNLSSFRFSHFVFSLNIRKLFSSPTASTRRAAESMSTVSTTGGSAVRGRRFRGGSIVWRAATRTSPSIRTRKFAAMRQWTRIWLISAELSWRSMRIGTIWGGADWKASTGCPVCSSSITSKCSGSPMRM